MLEIKDFLNSIEVLSNFREKIINVEGPTGNRYRDMYKEVFANLLDINNLINELNIDLFKITSKTEGLMIKDLTKLEVEFIALKYSNLTGQVKAVNRHQEYSKKKLDKINEKFKVIEDRCKEVIILINSLVSNIEELLRLEEKLRIDIDNNELINETIIFLSNNTQSWSKEA